MAEGVSDLVMSCVAENAAWCALVSRTHGIGTERAGGWTRTLRPAPAYHPDLMTLDPTVTAPEVAEQLRDRPRCSVKDSFAVLDLTDEGFERFFDAEWMVAPGPPDAADRDAHADGAVPTNPSEPVHPAGDPWVESGGPTSSTSGTSTTSQGRVSSGWHPVSDVEVFHRWTAGLDPDSPLRPALLDDNDTRVWLLEDRERTAGFIAHRSHHVVALTNAFAHGLDDATFWADRIALANRGWRASSGSLPVVCYQRRDAVATARAAGLDPTGALTVWTRGEPARP